MKERSSWDLYVARHYDLDELLAVMGIDLNSLDGEDPLEILSDYFDQTEQSIFRDPAGGFLLFGRPL